jgi:hypothetical protein
MKVEQAVAAGRTVSKVGFNALVVHFLVIDALMIGALMLVTLGRIRSRTRSSNPVVFNLSIAQVLRLSSHWSHISLI